jgi:hypothetical protein
LGYEKEKKEIYMKKDAMLSESMSQKKRENNGYLDAHQKERK